MGFIWYGNIIRDIHKNALKSRFRIINWTKNVKSINIDGHVKWKTCVLIEVTIFLTHLLNWWYWTCKHIRSHYFFGKRVL